MELVTANVCSKTGYHYKVDKLLSIRRRSPYRGTVNHWVIRPGGGQRGPGEQLAERNKRARGRIGASVFKEKLTSTARKRPKNISSGRVTYLRDKIFPVGTRAFRAEYPNY
jgi:hypothetical protein